MTHAELVKCGAMWLGKRHAGLSSPVVLTEYRSYAEEIPDVIGFSHYTSVVIECKVSLEDFRKDQKKAHRQRRDSKKLGNHRFYLCPNGLISPDHVPEGWGLLYCHDRQKSRITIKKQAPRHTEAEIRVAEYQILYSVARRAVIRGLMPEILTPVTSSIIDPRRAGQKPSIICDA
jgi:hypothetical protein